MFRLIFERDFKSGDLKFYGSPNSDQKGRIGLALRGHVTNASFKQSIEILLM